MRSRYCWLHTSFHCFPLHLKLKCLTLPIRVKLSISLYWSQPVTLLSHPSHSSFCSLNTTSFFSSESLCIFLLPLWEQLCWPPSIHPSIYSSYHLTSIYSVFMCQTLGVQQWTKHISQVVYILVCFKVVLCNRTFCNWRWSTVTFSNMVATNHL